MSEQADVREALHQYALSAPKTSGVYLWRDEKDIVIYVGKAKSLKNRLSSYFASKRDIKTRILVSRARRIEYIQTDNEYEALLLENNLIKKYKPRYNINLKDGKTYPVLKITNERYPRLYRTRRIQNDGARYFGPFPNVPAVDDFLSLIKRTYTLRQCKRLKKREPCLYFHIGRCSAPCADKISETDYRKDIDEIALLLEGDLKKPLAELTEKMKAAAAAREFEKAARIRDGMQAVRALRGQNSVEDMDPESRDYIGWAAEGALITFTVFKMRGGKVVGRDLYRTESLKDEAEVLPEFLIAYYTDPKQIPPHIFVCAGQEYELAEQWFADRLGVKVTITTIPLEERKQAAETDSDTENRTTVNEYAYHSDTTEAAAAEKTPVYGAVTPDEADTTPVSGSASEPEISKQTAATSNSAGRSEISERSAADRLPPSVLRRHKAALAMAQFNAKEDAARRVKELGDFPALEELQKILSLDRPPHRIEGFDIAHLHGKYTVASLISFKDGNPDKKNYRIFRLRTTDGIIDDYASMREAVARRYTRLLNEAAELPDLIMIDGGIGQVNAAKAVLDALELDIPLVGLAEKNEELYRPHINKPIVLPRRSAALRVLQRVRDETHRFANTRNNRLRSKEELHLQFEQLPHIGEKRAARLLRSFSSIEKLAAASAEAAAAAARITQAQAEEVIAAARETAARSSSL
ncbi:excinuclease ABC subunit UvrC [Treponema sp. OMZ 855]|uniref:excinuclease ABC subunit UvrC n=1 Tax=Treponema sp. OMZ 855 TaxID=1643512 RepID=UPI0020A5CF89|nr:excinuclease ABC subunit UvrC [Treponema sp. OMZ 855]UTC51330.1 excinuclease ABC subunit C [Treponema sp. OMZ 855]